MGDEPEPTEDRKVSLAPWILWSLGLAFVVLWLVVAIGFAWPHFAGANNPGIPDFLESRITTAPASQGEVNERMLAAQEAMAGFASWMYLLGIITVLTTAAGTFAIWRQIVYTRHALDVARSANALSLNAHKLQTRAYLNVDVEFRLSPNSQIIGFNITIINEGQTPVVDGVVEVTLVGFEKDGSEVIGGFTHQALAIGPKGQQKVFLLESDMKGYVWNNHLFQTGKKPIRLHVECVYQDIFGDFREAVLVKVREHNGAPLKTAIEGCKFT